jgi:hypothetical protein
VLVIPISSILDTARNATNVTAAMVASAIVARQEGELDDAVFNDEVEPGAAADLAPVAGVADETQNGRAHPNAEGDFPDAYDPYDSYDPRFDQGLPVGESCPI